MTKQYTFNGGLACALLCLKANTLEVIATDTPIQLANDFY